MCDNVCVCVGGGGGGVVSRRLAYTTLTCGSLPRLRPVLTEESNEAVRSVVILVTEGR